MRFQRTKNYWNPISICEATLDWKFGKMFTLFNWILIFLWSAILKDFGQFWQDFQIDGSPRTMKRFTWFQKHFEDLPFLFSFLNFSFCCILPESTIIESSCSNWIHHFTIIYGSFEHPEQLERLHMDMSYWRWLGHTLSNEISWQTISTAASTP